MNRTRSAANAAKAVLLSSFLWLAGSAHAQGLVPTTALATLTVEARTTDDAGRTVARARDHHVVVDAPPPLGGPNEAINPIEMLLSSLATCAVLVSEKAAAEQGIALHHAVSRVQGDLDPRGVRGEPFDPHIQQFRMRLELSGPTRPQAEALVRAIQQRCPVYTTLERASPVSIKVSLPTTL